MWELDYKESWVPKNWCFWTVVLEKTLDSPLDCKIRPVNPKGNQSWIFIGRTDAEAETPIVWPPDAKNWLIGKDPDAGKDWRWEEKGTTENEMFGWHHCLNGHEFELTLGDGDGQGSLACYSPWGRKERDMTEWLNWLGSLTLLNLEGQSSFSSSRWKSTCKITLNQVLEAQEAFMHKWLRVFLWHLVLLQGPPVPGPIHTGREEMVQDWLTNGYAQYTGKSHKNVHAAGEFFTLSWWRTSRKINLHDKQNFKKYIYLYVLPREKDHPSEGVYIESKGFFWWWASRKEKDWIDRRFRVEVHVWTS